MNSIFNNRTFKGRITFNDVESDLYLSFEKQNRKCIKISLTEYDIYSIPVYFIDCFEDRIEFFLWDSPLLGKCVFLKDDEGYCLSFHNVVAISESNVTMKETSFFCCDMHCGRIKESVIYQQKLEPNQYISASNFLNYEYVYEDNEYEKLQSLLNERKLKAMTNDFEKALYVMRYLHKLVISGGMTAYIPKERSGLTLLQKRINNEIQLNCRGCAIVFNDALLSMGIPSKIIACMSDDPYDPECHVTNSVYINKFKKWIILDSAIQSYIAGENGIPLSVLEVQYKLACGEQLKFMISPEIPNLNLTKHKFENYLIKNMFCFLSYKKNGPHCDDWNNKNPKYLLLPYQKESSYLQLNLKSTNTQVTYDARAFFEECDVK